MTAFINYIKERHNNGSNNISVWVPAGADAIALFNECQKIPGVTCVSLYNDLITVEF